MEHVATAKTLMKKIIDIYEVYYDLFVVNKEGIIVAAGNNQSQVGRDMSDRDWFKETIQRKDVYVSDMYFSSVINGHAMNYSAPVFDDNGEVLGVFTTRFNWEYVYEIIDNVKVDEESELYLINSQGVVIASKDRVGILERDLTYLEAVKKVCSNESDRGYTIERDSSHKDKIFAYCKTKGYNAYRGKGWSVIVSESI
ncbi:cache domain-containing protein [Bacillus sp. FJAT-45350]|uniref:cache domain-containing protein n=1 Tax=Bacillus sp. FJAT-45350 TaxID=2011014 RepID=UPI00359C5CB9